MARTRSGIPYADVDAAPRELVDAIRARRGGELLNLDRMLLHSPSLARAWNGMLGAIRGQLALPARLRELVVVAIGALNGAEYEWAQHVPEFLAAGGTRAQLAALRTLPGKVDGERFDAVERAVLALTVELTRRVTVKGATLKRVRAVLPEAQVVELVATVAAYNMVSRFVVATGIRREPRRSTRARPKGRGMHPDAGAIVHALGLAPHPEGGFYRETFRAPLAVPTSRGARAASTAIYYLLPAGATSARHRVASDEVWHHYAGDPLELVVEPRAGRREVVVLGPDVVAGQRPQAAVPAGAWQSARPLGARYALCGCTVAPGFDFADFELG